MALGCSHNSREASTGEGRIKEEDRIQNEVRGTTEARLGQRGQNLQGCVLLLLVKSTQEWSTICHSHSLSLHVNRLQ